MSALDQVDTIVLLMLENRSFDHLLGHLSLGACANNSGADGLADPLVRPQYLNSYQMQAYYPHKMRDRPLETDLPHDRNAIAVQMNHSALAGGFKMDGFAKSYFSASPNVHVTDPDPMGFLPPDDVPMSRFLADNYAVCDRWFASLPAGTQPNRLMAWTGTSLIDGNGLFPPRDPTLLDWMDQRQIRYRVYSSGLSFFVLFGAPQVFGPAFRNFARLAPDVANEKHGDFPQVIIIEPSYGDAVRITGGIATDYHAPAAAGPGEVFLRQAYEALTCNPERWARTLLVVTFDEHGGFYDHVTPPAVGYQPPNNAHYAQPFTSLGVRVPAFVVSPLVSPKSVCSATLDHTSLLQLLAEKFTPGLPYSESVEVRRQQGIRSVSEALDLNSPRKDTPVAPDWSTYGAGDVRREAEAADPTGANVRGGSLQNGRGCAEGDRAEVPGSVSLGSHSGFPPFRMRETPGDQEGMMIRTVGGRFRTRRPPVQRKRPRACLCERMSL